MLISCHICCVPYMAEGFNSLPVLFFYPENSMQHMDQILEILSFLGTKILPLGEMSGQMLCGFVTVNNLKQRCKFKFANIASRYVFIATIKNFILAYSSCQVIFLLIIFFYLILLSCQYWMTLR